MSDDRHTAEVDYLNAAMADRFGIATTVLRSLHHSRPVDGFVDRVHELEIRDGAPRAGLRWLDADAFEDAADRAAIERWRSQRMLHGETFDGREWTARGWFNDVCAWIDERLVDLGFGAAEQIRQIRSWPSSCVLHVKTSTTQYYFKALPNSGRVEIALTAYLARDFGRIVPELIAVQPERRWMLLAACSGRKLETVRDIALWERAAARYAGLQVACITRVDDLTALGVALRSPDSLAQRIRALAEDVEALRLGEPDGLSDAECRRLRAVVPQLQRRTEEIGACGIPLTLEHGDFWPGNIFVDDTSSTVIDWEDAVISHPFFSIAPLMVGLMNAGLGERNDVERVERAYAKAFESVATPDRVARALHLAAPLCFFEMAAHYRAQRASIAALHPWIRDLVPQALRLALLRL